VHPDEHAAPEAAREVEQDAGAAPGTGAPGTGQNDTVESESRA
jgi:hypothetical protein